jgi:HAD superfamily hydrolase (TIGR01450 family)
MPAGFAATDGPLAAAHDVALLDLDGVVYVGPHAVPHAAEALDAAFAQHGLRGGFVTNNAARPPQVVAEHLRSLGVRAHDTDVVTSAQAGARVLIERFPQGSPVLAVGGPGVPWALAERGLRPVVTVDDEPVAVMQGFGPEVGWRELAEATLAIGRGAVWVATNVDATIPTPRGRALGNGALVEAVRHATGVTPIVAGKPEPPLMVESVERTSARRPLVVGDRLDTDIEGAARAGIPSLLVLTGVTDWHDLLRAQPVHRPDYLAADLRGLLRPAPAVTAVLDGDAVTSRCRAAEVSLVLAPAGTLGPIVPEGVDWLPGALRPGVHHQGADALDLDLARALVAAAWCAADAGRTVAGVVGA